MEMLTIVGGVLLALFAFVDVWYFVRSFKLILKRFIAWRAGSRRAVKVGDVFRVSCVNGIVLPFDLDFNLHMNNSKYLRELDFGRYKLFIELLFPSKPKGRHFAMSAITIRYRQSMLLWQRFTIETRILCWKDDALYLEQRFVGAHDGFVFAIALIKFVIRGARENSMQVVMETVVGGFISSPLPPPEVQSWMHCIAKSSESLKNNPLRK